MQLIGFLLLHELLQEPGHAGHRHNEQRSRFVGQFTGEHLPDAAVQRTGCEQPATAQQPGRKQPATTAADEQPAASAEATAQAADAETELQ